MNPLLKKLQAPILVLLVLLPCLFPTAQHYIPKVRKVYTDYGLESEMRIPSQIMRRTITNIKQGFGVAQIRSSRQIFTEAGGIMFDATGQPCSALANAPLRLGYDRGQPDGKRLNLYAGTRRYTVAGVYDRDLRPIAEFAEDTIPVLTNVQYPDEKLREKCPLPGRLRIVTLHPAFLDTRLGSFLIGMDSIPWSFSRGERWDSTEPLPNAVHSLARSLSAALELDGIEYENAKSRARRTRDDVVGNKRVSNINDYATWPSFCTQGSNVMLDGLPRLEFLASWYDTSHVLETSSRLMTQNISQLRLVDQEGYDTVMKIYRLGGMFRHVKGQSRFSWKQFLNSLPPKERQDTYTIICPDCKKATVEAWLTCVERNTL